MAMSSGGSGTTPCHCVYALKANNTLEFWKYDLHLDKWTQLEDMPAANSGKRAKGGAALCYCECPIDPLFALKGNNTLDFYEYFPSPTFQTLATPAADNATGAKTLPGADFKLTVSPNPFSNATIIRYTLPRPGNATLSLYDITGQLVSTLATGYHNAGASSFIVHRSSLSSGIYVLRLSTETTTLTQKLIIE